MRSVSASRSMRAISCVRRRPSTPETPGASGAAECRSPTGRVSDGMRAPTPGGPMNGSVFEFERPLVELERKIQDLRELSRSENLEMQGELRSLEERADKLRREIYQNLTRWQRVQLARHPRRPFTLDYVQRMTGDF